MCRMHKQHGLHVEEPVKEVRLAAQELIQEVVKAASTRCVVGSLL
jgi:hypothetical protein